MGVQSCSLLLGGFGQKWVPFDFLQGDTNLGKLHVNLVIVGWVC